MTNCCLHVVFELKSESYWLHEQVEDIRVSPWFTISSQNLKQQDVRNMFLVFFVFDGIHTDISENRVLGCREIQKFMHSSNVGRNNLFCSGGARRLCNYGEVFWNQSQPLFLHSKPNKSQLGQNSGNCAKTFYMVFGLFSEV